MQLAEMITGLVQGQRRALAKAITLLESTRSEDKAKAEQLLTAIMPHTGKDAVRIGISGIPGVGKSTFIESLGLYLLSTDPQLKIAVLAIDPSSPLHGGSILGDKTRMEELSAHPQVFIRPSPNAGTLGGVARKSRESLLLMEAAGYPLILVETVGVGQSEYLVSSMVDAFLMLQMPHTGDELQGLKRGVLELADLIAINKADGALLPAAKIAKKQHEYALAFLSRSSQWHPPVLLCSALNKEGMAEVWAKLSDFLTYQKKHHFFAEKRRQQACAWFQAEFNDLLREELLGRKNHQQTFDRLQEKVQAGLLPASVAARSLIASLLSSS